MSELEEILTDPFKRDVLLSGFGTGNPIQLGEWYKSNFDRTAEELFVHNFLDFILTVVKVEGKTDEEAKVYAQAAYNVFCSIGFVNMDRYDDAKLVYPTSRFVEDLGFRKIDFSKLYGKLKHKPSIHGFHELKRVVDCINAVNKEYLENAL